MDLDKISNFISNLRKEKGLKQSDLANLTGASAKTISKWENGNGFPDLIYQKPLCDALGIDLDELQTGELNLKRRKCNFVRKIINWIFMFYAVVTIPLIIFLGFYYLDNYNAVNIYVIDTLNDSVDVTAQGMLFETNDLNTLYIGRIKLWNYEIKDSDIINVEVYNGNTIFYRTGELENIMINYDDNLIIDKENLTIKVTITSKSGKENVYETKIVVGNIKNSEIDLLARTADDVYYSEEDTIANLERAGFVQKNNNWFLIKNIKNKTESITYLNAVNKLNYTSNVDTISYNITFYNNFLDLEVYIYHKEDGKDVLFEKYTYNYLSDKINCHVGVCSTLQDVLEIMNPYVSLLIGEL